MGIKVTQIVPSIDAEASGPTYSVVRLCESLIQQDIKVKLISLKYGTPLKILSFHTTFPLGIGIKKVGRSPKMKYWLYKNAKEKKVDIIHSHGIWMMPGIYAGWASQKYDIPLVVSPRGSFSKYSMSIGSKAKKIFWPLLQRPALRSVACFHATSEYEYQDIRRLHFNQPVAIIPNGIDIPDLIEKKPRKEKKLLYLGRLHTGKGLDILLHAWKAVQDDYPNWQLQIIGPDCRGYLERLKILSADLLLKRVIFDGPIYGSNKWKCYAEADLYVLPSISENFAMTIAESLASGTPVIATKGTPWAGLEYHQAGWWIEIGKESLISCLKEALGKSSEELKGMGLKGREWMISDYAWSKIAKMMSDTYQWILGGHQTPSWVRKD